MLLQMQLPPHMHRGDWTGIHRMELKWGQEELYITSIAIRTQMHEYISYWIRHCNSDLSHWLPLTIAWENPPFSVALTPKINKRSAIKGTGFHAVLNTILGFAVRRDHEQLKLYWVGVCIRKATDLEFMADLIKSRLILIIPGELCNYNWMRKVLTRFPATIDEDTQHFVIGFHVDLIILSLVLGNFCS